jgi:hypothetical protein
MRVVTFLKESAFSPQEEFGWSLFWSFTTPRRFLGAFSAPERAFWQGSF